MKIKLLYPFCCLVLLTPISAEAHPHFIHTIGFWSGLLHPVSNLDHVTVVALLGCLAGWIYSNARYYFLTLFVGLMLLGTVINLISVQLITFENTQMTGLMTISLIAVSSFKILRPIQIFT